MKSRGEIFQYYSRLLKFLRPYHLRLVLGVIAGILYGATNGAFLFVVKKVWAQVFEQPTHSLAFWELIGLALLLPLVMFGRGLCDFLSKYMMNWVGLRVITDLRVHIFEHLQNLSQDFYNDIQSGEIISRLTNDVGLVQQSISTVVEDIIKQPFTLIAVAAMLFYTNWRLTSAALIVFPICLVPIVIYGRRVRKASQNTQKHLGSLLSVLQEAVAGSRVIKAFSMEEREVRDFREGSQNVFSQSMRAMRSQSIVNPIIEVLAALGIALVFIYAYQSQLQVSELVSMALGLYLMYEPVKKLSRVHLNIQMGMTGAERVFHLLDSQPTVKESPTATALPPFKRAIQFENISFRYQKVGQGKSLPVLDNVNLEIAAGSLVALVGPSGGGKTTFMNLILRFYDPVQGIIRIDNTNIADVTFQSLRNQIGLVTQETFLFNDSVANNIAYGNPSASRDEIINAAKKAHSHEFIMQMSQKYDTIVGESGVKLSGGQRQRLAIARAILKNPPILLLDEATSALDTESERAVQSALDDLMLNESQHHQHTMVVIAHRLSTVQHADRIIVLEKGRVVEDGTHKELLASGQLYKRLYDLQFSV